MGGFVLGLLGQGKRARMISGLLGAMIGCVPTIQSVYNLTHDRAISDSPLLIFHDATLNGQTAGKANWKIQYKRLDGKDYDLEDLFMGWFVFGPMGWFVPFSMLMPFVTQNKQTWTQYM